MSAKEFVLIRKRGNGGRLPANHISRRIDQGSVAVEQRAAFLLKRCCLESIGCGPSPEVKLNGVVSARELPEREALRSLLPFVETHVNGAVFSTVGQLHAPPAIERELCAWPHWAVVRRRALRDSHIVGPGRGQGAGRNYKPDSRERGPYGTLRYNFYR